MSHLLTQKDVLAVVDYCPSTGRFTRKFSGVNQYEAGKEAGGLDSFGYRRITINKKAHKAHRLAWLIVHGELPPGEIDHINGVRDDNRIENLRLADRYVNTQNCRISRRNKNGLQGVRHIRAKAKWRAVICVKHKTLSLGVFDTPEAAHARYIEAKQQMHACTIRTATSTGGKG